MKIIDGKVDNYLFPLTDEYFIKEYDSDFFEPPHIIDEFKENAKLLLLPIADIFPTYF